MSRTALLDNTLAFLVLLAFWILIYDRDQRDLEQRFIWTRPALAVVLGLALGTKWSALYYAVSFVILMLVWDFRRRTETATSVREVITSWLRSDVLPALHTPILAIGVYLLTWWGWFASSDAWDRNWAANNPAVGLMRFVPDALRSLLNYHLGMLTFHTNLDSPHSYQANPWTWPLMIRPTSFFYESKPTCAAPSCAQEVIPLGNPAIWWVGVIALLAVVLTALKFGNRNASAIAVAFGAGWVPWLFFTHRTVFTFYSIVFLPFTVLAIAMVANYYRGIGRKIRWRKYEVSISVLIYLVVVIVLAGFFFPLAVGASLPYESWHLRMWLPSWV
jgi:dolichyl-phosphate-mannose--protein O-mannosyl transferase